MAKNKEKPRPGVVIRFEWLPSLEKMSAMAQAKFLMSCLYRGQDITYEPDYEDLRGDPFDYARFETLWLNAAPKIDADGDGWKDGIVQRKYAGYCSGCQRTGETPMTFDEYVVWHDAYSSRVSELL